MERPKKNDGRNGRPFRSGSSLLAMSAVAILCLQIDYW